MSTDCSRPGRWEHCGARFCEGFVPARVTILAAPLAGPFRGKRLLLPVTGDVTILGSGKWLHRYVQAAWIALVPPRDDRYYAWSRIFGLLEVKGLTLRANSPSLKALSDHLGSGFALAQRGILVSLTNVLVPNVDERMCGMRTGELTGPAPTIDWVLCSRRGARRLVELLT